MDGMEWILEIVLVLMLAATLFHALRLERALGVLKRDRTQLEQLVGEFNAATRAAETSISRLHDAADGAGRQIGRHVESAGRLKDDLVFLVERGDRLADQLDRLVRAGRTLEPSEQGRVLPLRPDLPRAPRDVKRHEQDWADRTSDPPRAPEPVAAEASTRVRSQAERDLMKALRLAR
jgi:hypothetical protein